MTITREQIIAWAREAGMGLQYSADENGNITQQIWGGLIQTQIIERFAALIEQAVRAEENEQCAIAGGAAAMAGLSCDAVAAAIRARRSHD